MVESQGLASALAERAEALVHRAKADLERLHGQGRQHLTVEIEHEIHLIEQLVKQLRAHPEGHQFNVEEHFRIEEQLLHHENRLAEELRRIENHNDALSRNLHALIERAHQLEQRAKADLAKLHGSGRGHLAAEVEREVKVIEQLLHELRTHPHSQVESQQAIAFERRLAEHERRLAAELRRLEGQT